ncbi:hypothetical protein [Cohnella sp. REN36]|nr:hypothetical protein [Cohnella sp. REN36]MCC3375205.1 hypothetical protein [Cohnella sp. REN36]
MDEYAVAARAGGQNREIVRAFNTMPRTSERAGTAKMRNMRKGEQANE